MLTLADVADYYRRAWHPDGAVLVFGGEVTPEQAAGYARAMLDDWKPRSPPSIPSATQAAATTRAAIEAETAKAARPA